VTEDELTRLFDTFQRSAFRLEQLPQYLVPQEDELLADWRAGRSIRRTPETSDWLRLIADHTAAGRRVYRVHVVDWPLSEYTRFEIDCYPDNIAAGEDVYVADRTASADLKYVLREDFWLLDDRLVLLMRYDDEGHYLGADLADDELESFRRQRDIALAHAVPLDEWRAAHRRQLEELSLPA
jgi:hypothetical protein